MYIYQLKFNLSKLTYKNFNVSSEILEPIKVKTY